MNTSTLTKSAADVTDRVADTVSHGLEAVGQRIESVEGLSAGVPDVQTAVDWTRSHVPDVQTAADWARSRVPGVTPPPARRCRRRCEKRTLLGLLAVVVVIVAVACAVKSKRSEESTDT